MLLKDKNTGDLIRVDELGDLTDPFKNIVFGMAQAGEEEQDRAPFLKRHLLFPSGESLPQCWTDVGYRAPAQEANRPEVATVTP